MSRKHTLLFDEKKQKWSLKNDKTNRTLKSFASRDEAMRGGALRDALGVEGGSVKIRTREGVFREERTYPPRKTAR